MLDFFLTKLPKIYISNYFSCKLAFFADYYWKFDGFLQSSGAKLWLIYLFLADKTMSHASQTQKKLILKISVGHIFRIPPVIFNVRLSFMCFFSLSTLVIAIFNNISLCHRLESRGTFAVVASCRPETRAPVGHKRDPVTHGGQGEGQRGPRGQDKVCRQ